MKNLGKNTKILGKFHKFLFFLILKNKNKIKMQNSNKICKKNLKIETKRNKNHINFQLEIIKIKRGRCYYNSA